MIYVTYEQMTADARALARKLPRNIYGVLGIPRSGMMVASILAQELDCHLGDAYHYAATGAFSLPGPRLRWPDVKDRIVVVDDSVYSGQAMLRALGALNARPAGPRVGSLITAALYVRPGEHGRADYHVRELETPRLFAWNWRSHDIMERTLWDMDGALCVDPEVKDDDGPAYAECLRFLDPLYVPQRKILGVVTARLEKHRARTETWLRDHHVEFGHLFMGPWETPEQRRAADPSRWKADVYATREEAALFVESDGAQAERIWALSGKPTFRPGDGGLLCK